MFDLSQPEQRGLLASHLTEDGVSGSDGVSMMVTLPGPAGTASETSSDALSKGFHLKVNNLFDLYYE